MNNPTSMIFLLVAMLTSCNTKQSTEKQTESAVVTPAGTRGLEPKVTGIGGIFFLSKDPSATSNWYGQNLGLAIDNFGSAFEFRNANTPEEINYLRWAPFEENSDYLEQSNKDYMINYRVQNIEGLLSKLKKNGVTVVDEIAEYPYGKFVHIIDPEGTKVELWEPVDSFFTEMGGATTK